MKQQLTILAAVVVIFVCSGVAIVASDHRKANTDAAQSSAVQSFQTQLKSAQDTQKLHDSVNTTAIKNAGDQIINLTNQKTTLCAQIKAAKLVQPICP